MGIHSFPMATPFVILTGASGAGKTAIADEIARTHPSLSVFYFDSIGVPTPDVMASYGTGHQPGGAWQRAMTMEWLPRITSRRASSGGVLFEGQMRISFIMEALVASDIGDARIVLVDCDDMTRIDRLSHGRKQPDLATESMMGWARYLRDEAAQVGVEVLDTSVLSLQAGAAVVASYLL